MKSTSHPAHEFFYYGERNLYAIRKLGALCGLLGITTAQRRRCEAIIRGAVEVAGNSGLLTSRIGNPSLSRLESGFPGITEPPLDHDYLSHGYVLGRTATQLAGR